MLRPNSPILFDQSLNSLNSVYALILSVGPADTIKAYTVFTNKANDKALIRGRALMKAWAFNRGYTITYITLKIPSLRQHQRENAASPLITEDKSCQAGSVLEWVNAWKTPCYN